MLNVRHYPVSGSSNSIIAGNGLVGGGNGPSVSVGLSPGYMLPQGCAEGQIPVASSSGWQCGAGAGDEVSRPGLIVFSSPGTYTYAVPAGVTALLVTLVGGGGGGGAGHVGFNGGGRGGQAATVEALITGPNVAFGERYTVLVGAGGQGGFGSDDSGTLPHDRHKKHKTLDHLGSRP